MRIRNVTCHEVLPRHTYLSSSFILRGKALKNLRRMGNVASNSTSVFDSFLLPALPLALNHPVFGITYIGAA